MNTEWLNQQSQVVHNARLQDESSDSESGTETPAEQETPMEQDGWTEVKSRKKR